MTEPRVTERDVAMLLLSEDALLALGAVLGWQARAALQGSAAGELREIGEIGLTRELPA